MAKLGSITLFNESYPSECGAAFLYTNHRGYLNSCTYSMKDEWELVCNPDTPYVVLRGASYHEFEQLHALCYQKAQQALDMLSIRNINQLSTKRANEFYLLWWTIDGKKRMRLVDTTHMGFRVGSAELTVTDASGQPAETPPQPHEIYHESLRFFRLAQIAEDVYSAYRNMWLAFELLLSTHYVKRQNENEMGWLETATRQVTWPSLQNVQDVSDYIVNTLYKRFRLDLFHAKSNRTYTLPNTQIEHDDLTLAFRNLSALFIHMAERLQDVRFSSSFVFLQPLRRSAESILAGSHMLVTSIHRPFDPSESYETIKHLFDQTLGIDLELAENPAVPGGVTIVAEVDQTILEQLGSIRSLYVAKDVSEKTELLLGTDIETLLYLDGIQTLEVYFQIQMRSSGGIRTDFNL